MQVVGRAVKTAIIASIAIVAIYGYYNSKNIDFVATLTYYKAQIADNFNDGVRSFRQSINKQAESPYLIKISAKDKHGIYSRNTEPKNVLQHRLFIGAKNHAWSLLSSMFMIWTISTSAIFVLVSIYWAKFGKASRGRKLLSGNTINTAEEVAKFLKKNKLASDLSLGDIPLIKNSETKHILITGSTGTGKTNCLHTLLPQIRNKNQPAIVVDTEGDMVSRYYRPGRDIIINPFDSRTYNWDFWQEVKSSKEVKKVASSFFPDSPPDVNDYDKKWNNWGRMLFVGSIEYLKDEGNPTVESLYNLIHKEPIDVLAKKLKDTSVSSLLGSSSPSNAAPHNIRINTLLATEWLEFIADSNERKFSFNEWFSALDSSKDDRWIFISSSGGDTKVLLPFLSVMTDIAINCLIDLGPNQDRRVWFIFDELAKLKYLPALQENITLLRKYGGCILAATQSLKQIFAHYGRNSGSVMLGQFNTNVIFKILETDEAQILAKRIGEIEYLTHQKNTSYGAHEFRDGISYTEQERKESLIKPNDFANLREREAYILLPEREVAISKTKFDIVARPKAAEPHYIENPELETLVKERKDKWKMLNKAIEKQQDIENEQQVASYKEDQGQKLALADAVTAQADVIPLISKSLTTEMIQPKLETMEPRLETAEVKLEKDPNKD